MKKRDAPGAQTRLFSEDPTPAETVKFQQGSLNQQIYDFFKAHPKKFFTPYDVFCHLVVKDKEVKLTSVRRSLTTLADMGLFIHHPKKRKSAALSTNGTWQFNVYYKPYSSDEKNRNSHE